MEEKKLGSWRSAAERNRTQKDRAERQASQPPCRLKVPDPPSYPSMPATCHCPKPRSKIHLSHRGSQVCPHTQVVQQGHHHPPPEGGMPKESCCLVCSCPTHPKPTQNLPKTKIEQKPVLSQTLMNRQRQPGRCGQKRRWQREAGEGGEGETGRHGRQRWCGVCVCVRVGPRHAQKQKCHAMPPPRLSKKLPCQTKSTQACLGIGEVVGGER